MSPEDFSWAEPKEKQSKEQIFTDLSSPNTYWKFFIPSSHTSLSLTDMEIRWRSLSWALIVVAGETNSGVPVMAVFPVICDLWPNVAWRSRTKDVCHQIASGTKQKPPLLMRQKACGSPTNPQELPVAAQTKPEIKRSQRQAHFYSKAKVFLFMASVESHYGIIPGQRQGKSLRLFHTKILKNQVSGSLSVHTSHYTLWANFKGTKTSSCIC